MNNEARLTELKRAFYFALLENSVLARLVIEAMDKTGNPHLLPDFVAEPWYNPKTEAYGLAYARSASAQDGALSTTFSTFAYVELLTVASEPTDATFLKGAAPSGAMFYFDAPAALMEMADVPLTERAQAVAYALKQWQAFNRAAIELGAEIDPMMGTFTTEPRNYETFE